MSTEDDNLRRLMEGARTQMESSFEEFRRRLDEGVTAGPAPAPPFQWGRITMAAILLVCVTVLATIVTPRAPNTATPTAQDDEKVEALVKQLSDDRPEVREEATVKLIAYGDSVIERMQKLVDDKDPEVAARARRIIDGINRALLELPEHSRQKLSRVQAEIKRLRGAKQEAEADKLAARLRTLRREVIAGEWPAGVPEVHVVGLYEPRADDDQRVDVRVTFTGAPIVLVLCAYDQVFWRVTIDKGVRIAKVLVGGYHHQGVEGLPKEVPVEKHVHEDGSTTYFYGYARDDRDDDGWPDMEQRVRSLTGSPLWSFQGMYQYKGREFVVGAETPDWLAQRRAAYVECFCAEALRSARKHLLGELDRLRFWAVAAVDEIRGGTAIGEFTIAGEKSRIETKQSLMQVVADGKGRLWGATGSGIVQIDPKSGGCTELKQERRADLPRVSHAAGIAWDSKRGRLLLAAGGILYAVEPEKNEWTVLCRFARADRVSGLAYAADEDVTYAVVVSLQRHQQLRTIAKLDAEGRDAGSITLSEPVPLGEKGLSCGVQAVCLEGKRLVLIVPPGRDENGERAGGARTFVIDRTTGEIELER